MGKDGAPIGSIYDLAREAGVSYATVSRILNGRGRASEETKKKVLELAEKAKFRPRQQARRTTIAFVSSSVDRSLLDEYYIHLMLEMFKQISAHDLSMEIYAKHNISKLRHAMIDGILFMPWNTQCCEIIDGVSKAIPKVVSNNYGPAYCAHVMSDHYQSGHKHAGFIIVDAKNKANAERANGFRTTYLEKGIELPENLFFDLTTSMQHTLEKLLATGATAVFLATEGRIPQFAAALREMGVKIPRDLSVIAMESYGLNEYQDPPYTAIQQPLDMIAAKSVDLLISKIATGDCSPDKIILDNFFMERKSVADLSQG